MKEVGETGKRYSSVLSGILVFDTTSTTKRPQGAESSGQKVLPTQTERKRVGTAPGGSRADSASAATRAIAHRAPAGRRQPALRSRDAHSPPCRTSGAQSAPYAACWSANHHASRELTTKRTIGADPLSNRKRVRRPRSAFVELLLGRAIGGPPGPTRWRAGGRHARPRSRLADDPFGGRPPNIAAAVAASSSRLLSPGAAPADRPCHPHRSVPTPSLPSLPSPSLPSPSPPSPPPPLAFFAAAALAAASSPPPRRLRRSVSRVARRLRHVWRCDAPVCNATTLVVGPPVLIR